MMTDELQKQMAAREAETPRPDGRRLFPQLPDDYAPPPVTADHARAAAERYRAEYGNWPPGWADGKPDGGW